MKIGIIGAMEEEVTLLRDKIENRQTLSLGGCEIYTGQLNGVDVALLKSGIGKVAAALGATLLLERCKPDVIVNTGSAGGLAPTLKVGDIVVSDEARYHDADVTAFGYEYGQLPGCPAGFKADDKLVAAAEECIAELNLNAVRGLIVSGDAFINGSVGRQKSVTTSRRLSPLRWKRPRLPTFAIISTSRSWWSAPSLTWPISSLISASTNSRLSRQNSPP